MLLLHIHFYKVLNCRVGVIFLIGNNHFGRASFIGYIQVLHVGKPCFAQMLGHDMCATVALDAKEYFNRVADHIYTGNEIRADSYMDISEKQDEIRRLDRKRIAAHDKMLKSFVPFLGLLRDKTAFDEDDYRLENRTQVADFVALIAFELIGTVPTTKVEGGIRDELAEKIHLGEIKFEEIKNLINDMFDGGNR